MKIQIARLPIPELEFGGVGFFQDPRLGLAEAGPFDSRFGSAHKTQIRVSVVGTSEGIDLASSWLRRCKSVIGPRSPDGSQIAFPGFDVVFRSELVVHEASNVVLHEQQLEKALGLKPYDGLEAMVNVYASAINRAKEDFRPDVVACVVPEPVERKFWSVSRMLSRMERDALKRTATATASLQMQLPFDWEVEEQSEDLLTRDFRRALKARAMQIGVPIQLLRNSGMIDLRTNEEPAARAWNLSVGLYYKAGGIPWRVRNRGPETCFVGITFHHLRTTKRALVHSALAQAFSTNGGGFALRGQSFEPERDASTRTPHLTEQQADELGKLVIDEYTARNGELPKRIVLHKSSRFWRQEQEGFLKAFREVPVVKLVALAPSSVRFVTQGVYPPARGTLVTVDEKRHFLFTSGFVPELGTYPGPHIPIPVELIVHGEATMHDVRECAVDALGLGRLNWNTSDLRSSQPVTLGFARRVGGIMAEYGQLTEARPDPSYRYYM
jgi:hypothetical protein